MLQLIIFIIICFGLPQQGNEEAIVNKYVYMENKLDNNDKVTLSEIKRILMTVSDKQQMHNAEIDEWCNELLFRLLDKHTGYTIKAISLLPKQTRILIYKEYANPTSDVTDIQLLYDEISQSSTSDESLMKALEKSITNKVQCSQPIVY